MRAIPQNPLMPANTRPAPTKPERKVVQITGSATGVWALCDDGSIFGNYVEAETWRKLPPIPQD